MTDTFCSFTRNVLFKSCFLLSDYGSIPLHILFFGKNGWIYDPSVCHNCWNSAKIGDMPPINIPNCSNLVTICKLTPHECTKLAVNPTHVSGTASYWHLYSEPPPPPPPPPPPGLKYALSSLARMYKCGLKLVCGLRMSMTCVYLASEYILSSCLFSFNWVRFSKSK